ncbi:MAG: nucleotidyltransferase domain-containing protein [Clostridia bacterium]|nr:nucleotidyltransferase domain-containing protein [Clostridia bacterium]MDH7572243.1 nucleotidyltransferase domain-containing protein [Clostridia bacterium]
MDKADRASGIGTLISAYLRILSSLGIEVSRVYLFGSCARGSERGDSDIDLIVVSPSFEGMDLRQRAVILGRAAGKLMAPIDARGYTPEEISLDRLDPAGFLWDVLVRQPVVEYAQPPDQGRPEA